MELCKEEKREEGDRGDQEEKRGSQRRETDLASNQFPKCSQQYVNCEFPDVQAGFRKGRGTRDQIANIC